MSVDMINVEESPKRVLRTRKEKPAVLVEATPTPSTIRKKIIKPDLTMEEIYLQKDFIPSHFVGTSLETIYESPKLRGTRNSIMGVLKLRRNLKFNPYTPSKHKITKRINQTRKIFKRHSNSPACQKIFIKKLSSLKGNFTIPVYENEENYPSANITSFSSENIPITGDSCHKRNANKSDSDNAMDFELTSNENNTENQMNECYTKRKSDLTSNYSSSLFWSDNNAGRMEISDIDIELDNILPLKTVNRAVKKRRSSKQFSGISFMDICENKTENQMNECYTKRKSDQVLENAESYHGNETEHSHSSWENNRNRNSGVNGYVSTDQLSAIRQSSLNCNQFSGYKNNECILSDEINCKKLPEIHSTRNIFSKRNNMCPKISTNNLDYNCDFGKDSSYKVDKVSMDSVSNLSLSPTLINNLVLSSPKRSKSRRRSARLSIADKNSLPILGSLWRDE